MLARNVELRDRDPGIEIMMGTGNVSELTDADTAGLHAFMLGVMSDLRIIHLLTTEDALSEAAAAPTSHSPRPP